MSSITEIILNGTTYTLGGSGTGLTADIKAALEQIAQKIAYIDENGQTYYNALHDALYPPAGLSYITCGYTQTGVVYVTDSLDDLRSDLVVTAHYDNGTTSVVSSYLLSGSLTEGTSTITVTYGGKTTSFNVTVTNNLRTIPHSGGGRSSEISISDGVLTYIRSSTVSATYYQAWEAECSEGDVIHLVFDNPDMVSCKMFFYIIDSNDNILYSTPDVLSVSGNLDETFTWKTSGHSTSTGPVMLDDSYFTAPATGKVVIIGRAAGYLPSEGTVGSIDRMYNAIQNGVFDFTIEAI